ncbi:uracil-DNA glycosylase [Desulfogranum marinum]|uniref:uracil-DNA glycosylase n=1 Tax=Desulfogranum marinum TaxID=453220 RepID=UPI0029C90C16|nr:uracil-DNA glycosylase [Desulfogranum marinum]
MSAKNKTAGEKAHSSKPQPDACRLVRMGNDLRRLLLFHQQVGIGSYPMVEGLENITLRTRRSRPSSPPLPLPARKKVKKPVTAQKVSGSSSSGTNVKAVKEIFQNIADCVQCSLSEGVPLGLPARLPHKVSLMIIGDYCLDTSKEQAACFFGMAEDKMLAKMISALGLKQEDVYITNCIKCCCSDGIIPGDEQLQKCRPYLAREIAAVKPAVICAMGDLSAKAVLDTTEPVVRLRGTFRRYRYYEEHPVEVMVTFHPRFLLAHEEMKRATWNDLQQIQKRFLMSKVNTSTPGQ